MRTFVSFVIAVMAASAALAFDSAGWHEKRGLLLREAERLRVAYSNCLSRVKMPAEDVTVPVETFDDGSVKTVVSAKKAQFFVNDGLVWAEGVVIKKFKSAGVQETLVEASSCVVDRVTKSGWAEGPALVRHGNTSFRGDGVYFSSPEGYVRVFSNADIESDDLSSGGGLKL